MELLQAIFTGLAHKVQHANLQYFLMFVAGAYLSYLTYLVLYVNGRVKNGMMYLWGAGSAAKPPKKSIIDGHTWSTLDDLKAFSNKNAQKPLTFTMDEFRYFEQFARDSKIPKWLKNRHESTEIVYDATDTARGVLGIGGAGAGKTEWLNFIINQPFYKKAVIYDKKGSLGEFFYRPGIDILVNPKLEEGVIHDVLSEDIQYIMAFINTLMNASIGKSQDYFSGSAKQKLEKFCQKIKVNERDTRADVREKWNLLIQYYEEAVQAAESTDQKSEKDVMGTVRATMEMLYLTAYRIENGARTFTAKEFFSSPVKNRIFLNDTDESMRGILAATISVLVKYQLAMRDIKEWDPEYLVAYFLDEYLSLAAAIEDELLAEISRVGRSKGICPFKLIQSLPTEKEELKELISNIQYLIIFATVEPETLNVINSFIGKIEYSYKETTESRGSSGTTYNTSLKTDKRDILTAAMIKDLQKEGFSHVVYGPKLQLLYKGYTKPADLKVRKYVDLAQEIDLADFYKWKLAREEQTKKPSETASNLASKFK